MKKRILCGLLAAAMLLSFASCTGGEGTTSDVNSNGNASSGDTTASSGSEESVGVLDKTISDDVTPTGTVYYVSANGDDKNAGTSEDKPFKTLANLASVGLKKGDAILFERGGEYAVNASLSAVGTAEEPIIIGVYGSSGARPVISETGLTVKSAGGYLISGLDFRKSNFGILLLGGEGDPQPIRITGCSFTDLKEDLSAALSGSAVSVKGDYGYVGTGIALAPSASGALENVAIDSCTFYDLPQAITVIPVKDGKYAAGNILSKLWIKNCQIADAYGIGGITLTNADQVAISGVTITGTGSYGGDKTDSAALRIAACSNVTVSGSKITATAAYGKNYRGTAVLLEGKNEKLTFTGCRIADNLGAAIRTEETSGFSSGSSEATFKDCALVNNNTGLIGSNAAFSVTGKITVTGGQIALNNDAQKTDGPTVSAETAIYSLSGKTIQGKLPADAVISRAKLGIGRAKVTPEEKAFIWGYDGSIDPSSQSWCDPATDILDDTWVKVMVFEDTQTKVRALFMIFDACTISEDTQVYEEGWFAHWAELAGVAKDNLFAYTTHDHQAMEPTTYTEKYLKRIDQAIKDALKNMQTVNLGVAVSADDISTSRRPNLAIGKRFAFDNSLTLVNVTSTATGKPVTYLTNIAIHNTFLGNGQPQNHKYNTSELTGNAMSYIEKKMGGSFTSVFINGAYGDAGPNVNGKHNGTYKAMVARAEEFGAKCLKLLQNIPVSASGEVVVGREGQRLNYRPKEEVVVSACAVGELALLGVSNEIHSGIGASIKEESPFAWTITTAGWGGKSGGSYMPTNAAMQDGYGGYGTEQGNGNSYRVGIEDIVRDLAKATLSKMKGEDGDAVFEIKSVMGAKSTQSQTPLAFDKDPNTGWSCTDLAGGWLQCDLGQTKLITGVSLDFGNFLRYDAPTSFEVLVSDSKLFETYEVLGTVTDNTACGMKLSGSVKGRYVRVRITGINPEKNTTKIYEILVHGKTHNITV
ncbi:MAG: discoidin domain-containing protein [Oscillospiraceae bacterium]|nr:discoidin domain-containing protein [Oscillospiraceae bacterium]